VFSRLRLHFVGTSYAANGSLARVVQMAREVGIEQFVNEQTVRVPYLESLQIMLDSNAILLVGSDEPHYTASKVFPSLLARRPLMAVFHEESTVNDILRNKSQAITINYSRSNPPETRLNEIQEALRNLITGEGDLIVESQLNDAGFFTARKMTARLVTAFERALAKNRQTEPVKRLSQSLTK
jgi:hypothetical protein